jgi:phosphate transport system substrate-binding protein
MPTPDVTCPECGSRLLPMKGDGKRRLGVSTLALLAGAVIALLLGLGWFGFQSLGKGRSQSVTPPSGGDYASYDLRLSGSNTIGGKLGPDLVKAWLLSKGATEFKDNQRLDASGKSLPEHVITAQLNGKAFKVELRAHGSATAFQDLASGTAEIGMASRPVKIEEVDKLVALGPMQAVSNEHVLGLDGVAVIVPASNDVPKLSREELRRIFSGQAARWSEFGGPDRPIHLYARNDQSGTFDTFKALVLKDDPLAANAKRFEDSAELEKAVAIDPDGIGFVGLPYRKTTRAVPISDGSSPPLEPTSFTIKTENYPLSRRLFLYTAQAPANANVRDFVNFALSSAGQAVVRADGFEDLDLNQTVTPPPKALGTCMLSDRFKGDRDAYCALRDRAEQLGTSFRFRTGSAELDTRATQDLRRVLERMANSSGKQIVLAGFADSSGPLAGNCKLSRSRAESVAAALHVLGLNATQVIGFCDELPVRDNSTPDGREQNRRVEIFLQ